MKADAMAIKEYLNTNHVFSAKNFKAAFSGSVTDTNLLARALKGGKVRRVRHGLYVSESERFFGIKPSPLEIASNAVDDAVFCYLSALQLHGVLHNAINNTQFYTRHRIPNFEYDGNWYHPFQLRERTIESQTVLFPSGSSYRVTTREQTVADCLFRLSYAGGPENALRSFSGFRYLDTRRAAELAARTNGSTCARLGWVLDIMQNVWEVGGDVLPTLHMAIGAGPHYFYSSTAPKDCHWVKAWKLYLPDTEEEMAAWLKA
jgi:predicted transcriptional regulator of viral defense system